MTGPLNRLFRSSRPVLEPSVDLRGCDIHSDGVSSWKYLIFGTLKCYWKKSDQPFPQKFKGKVTKLGKDYRNNP
jgi:hypothetical protein